MVRPLQEPVVGPQGELSTDHLLLVQTLPDAPLDPNGLGARVSTSVTFTNTGTTALHYTWAKRAQQQASTPDAHSTPQRFHLADRHGVVLPGSSRAFAFSFVAHELGIFTEPWDLTTQPALPGGVVYAPCLKT